MQLVAGAPSPSPNVMSDVTTEVVLQMYVGLGIEASAVTFTVIVQLLPAPSVAPVREMLFEAGTAIVDPGGVQPSTSPFTGLATVNPVGRVSVNEMFVTAKPALGLVRVNFKPTVPPGNTVCERNVFFKTGGTFESRTTRIAMEGVPLPPLVEPGVTVFV